MRETLRRRLQVALPSMELAASLIYLMKEGRKECPERRLKTLSLFSFLNPYGLLTGKKRAE